MRKVVAVVPSNNVRQLTFGIGFGIQDQDLRQANRQVDLFKGNVNQSAGALGRMGTAAMTAGRNMKQAFTSAMAVLERYRFYIYGAFTTLTGAIVGTTKAAGDFDYQLTKTGLVAQATAEEVDQLRENAMQLGIDTAFTAKEAAEGQELLARAGFEVREIMETIPAVLNAAAIENMELSQAADIVAMSVRSMGYEVDQAERVIDVLAMTSAESSTNVEELGTAIPEVAGSASRLGIEIEELSAALGILADRGDRGSRAGRRLRGVFSSLTAPTDQAKSAMADLGVDVWDAQGNLISLTEIIGEFEDAMSHMTAQEQQEALGNIFRAERAETFGKLISGGREEMLEFSGVLDEAGGTAERMAREQLATLNGAIQRLRGSINVAAINVGTFFLPTITRTIDTVTGMINIFNEAPPATQALAGGLLAVGAASLGVLTAVLLLKKPVLAIAGVFGTVGSALGITASGAAIVAGVVIGLGLAFEDLFYTMEHGYDGVLAPLINRFFELIDVGYTAEGMWESGKEHIVDFLETVQKVNQGIQDIVEGGFNLLVGFFTGDTQLMAESWEQFVDGLGDAGWGVIEVFTSIGSSLLSLDSLITDIFTNTVLFAVEGIVENIWDSAAFLMEEVFNAIGDKIEDWTGIEIPEIELPSYQETKDAIHSWFDRIWDTTIEYWTDFDWPDWPEFELPEFPNIVGALGDWWDNVTDRFRDIISWPEIPTPKLPSWLPGVNGSGDENVNVNTNVETSSGSSPNVNVEQPSGRRGANIQRDNSKTEIRNTNDIDINIDGAGDSDYAARRVKEKIEEIFEVINVQEGGAQ